MANPKKVTLLLKRGLKKDLPTLAPGEAGFATDTKEFFVGSETGNIPLANTEKVKFVEDKVTGVETTLGNKADKSYVDTELGKKANASSLGNKADKTYVDTELGKKADTTALSNKADKTEVTTLTAQLAERTKDIRPAGNTVVALGDSITAGNIDLVNNAFGDTSWFQQFIIRSKGKVQYVHNAGIPGNTTTQMLARIQTDVISKKPKMCIILGGTNDVGNSLSHTLTQSNLEEMINVLLSNKITPVLCTIPPRNDATMQPSISKVNIIVTALATKYGLHLIDFYSALVDPTNGFFKNGTTLSVDGIHPTSVGSKIMSTVAEQTLLPVLPAFSSLVSKNNLGGLNLISNGLFLNDGNSDGVPDSWTAYGGTAANVEHSITSGDLSILGNWVQMKVNTSTTRIVESVVSSSGYTIGDRIAIFGKINALAEVGALKYSLKVNFSGASKSIQPLKDWTVDIDGSFYVETIVPVNTSAIQFSAIVNSGVGTLKLSQCGVLNLTNLGL